MTQLFRNAVVVTNCTTRKKAGKPTLRLAAGRRSEGPEEIANRWVSQLAEARSAVHVRDFYLGRSFREAENTARCLKGALHVISAGLGLVEQNDMVPRYDLTVAPGSPFGKRLARTGIGPESWWAALNDRLGTPKSLQRLIGSSDGIVLIALTGTYVGMIRGELAQIKPALAKKIRIFTSQMGRESVPPNLEMCVMPYDNRIETIKGWSGTQSDFPQRAMRHFVEELEGHLATQHDGRALVTKSLSGRKQRVIPDRARKTDKEIKALLRSNWSEFDGRSTRLLRFLRDDALVACEQGRFRQLWTEVRGKAN